VLLGHDLVRVRVRVRDRDRVRVRVRDRVRVRGGVRVRLLGHDLVLAVAPGLHQACERPGRGLGLGVGLRC